MNSESNPFGITLAEIEAFDRAREGHIVHNSPIRNVDKESFWDFMSSPSQGDEDVFTPETLDFFREGRN